MGYLLAVSIGFAAGWISAALFIPGQRLRAKPASRQESIDSGADPVCESCRLMGNV